MEEIINSIMHNPENTNPNVLRDQLQGISSGAGIVIIDQIAEILEDKTIVRLIIKAEELYNLSKNNIVFCKEVSYLPSGSSVESYKILCNYSYELIQFETGSEMGYRFELWDKSTRTFLGTADDYPYYEIKFNPGGGKVTH